MNSGETVNLASEFYNCEICATSTISQIYNVEYKDLNRMKIKKKISKTIHNKQTAN